MALVKIAESLWVEEQPLSVFGIELGMRMTVVDVDGQGTLFVHSPNRLTEESRRAIEAIGRVAYVVSPNKWHHLFIEDFRRAFPEARFFCAPGLETKRPDFRFDGVINEEQNYPWNPALAHASIGGVPMYNEVVFFHPASRTLVLTDLAVHICESPSLYTRFWLRLLGSYGKFGWSRAEKFLFIKDRDAFQRTMVRVMAWDFDRIVLSHGKLIASGGKERMRRAFL